MIWVIALVRGVEGWRGDRTYLDHGYERHDSLHVLLQLRQGSQLTRNHFVVRQRPVVALDGRERKQQQVRENREGDRDVPSSWWRHRNMYFTASLHHGHPTFAYVNVYHSALMFLSHFVVLSEQGQGAVLPRRVALGNVDVAVGGLGRGFWVTFLLGGKTASEKEHLRFIYPHCQVHKTWWFCFYSARWQDNSNGGWRPQWEANSELGLVKKQAAFFVYVWSSEMKMGSVNLLYVTAVKSTLVPDYMCAYMCAPTNESWCDSISPL